MKKNIKILYHIIFFIQIFLSFSTLAFTNCPDLTQKISCKGSHYPVHLTFDDGPSDYNTAKVLDILKSENVKATFFLKLNRVINRHDEKINISKRKNDLQKEGINNYYYFLLERMKNEHHNIGSHTYNHIHHQAQAEKDIRFLRKRGEKEDHWLRNIDKSSSRTLEKYLFYKGIAYLRLPYGQGWYEQKSRNPSKKRIATKIMDEIERINFKHVGWNIDSNDWRYKINNGQEFITDNLEQICNNHGGVMLMHDTKDITAQNLKCLIENMQKMSFEFTSLEKLQNVTTLSGLKVIGRNSTTSSANTQSAKSCPLTKRSPTGTTRQDPIGDLIQNLGNPFVQTSGD